LERLEDRCVPSTLVALSADNHLLKFDSASPGTVSDVAVSGLQPNEHLAAIAFRPSDGQLFGVTFGALYQLDAVTASAALVGASPTLPDPRHAGASFDPTSGKLRVAGNDLQHGLSQNLLTDPPAGPSPSTRPSTTGQETAGKAIPKAFWTSPIRMKSP